LNPTARPGPQAPAPIQNYALLGDGRSAALVSRDGSIDWLCWPRFDSPACFAALLGTPEHGRWWIGPDAAARVSRRYRPDTLVLETTFETDTGRIVLTDFMAVHAPALIRIVECQSGTVAIRTDFAPRRDYGATADPHGFALHGPTTPDFTVRAGQRVCFAMTDAASPAPDPERALTETEAFWRAWSGRCTYHGRHRDIVLRSLLTLKALCHTGTGGIVAAPTTSLPEQIGGERNWDYRFCWPRDSSLTVRALRRGGYREEAKSWFAWLDRATGSAADRMRPLYGLDGDAATSERILPWLPGYRASAPVRVGNAAAGQLQLDVYGELLEALSTDGDNWPLQTDMIARLEDIWRQPDEGIWETRGGRRHFTFSKVMAWVAVDRALRCAAAFSLPAPTEQWRALRDTIHAEVCRHGFNAERNSFTQIYGGKALDASLLLLPAVGFLPASDPRIAGTIAAIEQDLIVDGFVLRYRNDDGLPPGEGAFLACSFWYADALILQGRHDEAEAVFSRLTGLANDVGLLSEEYAPIARRMLGNFPQGFSHLALIDTALNLDQDHYSAGTAISA